MKDLLDRYLAAVARDLPEAQRADITAELRDELLSKIEAQEGCLGRPLTSEELEAALVEFGNPLVVAGRYRKTQHLIGPEVFPFWWAGLRASLVVVAVVYLVLAILTTIAGGEAVEAIDKAAPSLVITLVFTFGVVTLICAAVERYGKPGTFGRWKPRNLPPARGRTRGRFEVMVEIGMGLFVLLWWTGAIHFRNLMPELWLRVDLAPVWAAWFWPIVAYFLFELGMNLTALLRPAWVRLNGILTIVRNLAGATILSFVLQADRIVDVTAAQLRPEVLAEIQANFDRGFRVGIAATILLFLWLAALQTWRLRQYAKAQASPATA